MERKEQENWHLVLFLRTHLARQYHTGPGVLAMLYIHTKKNSRLPKFPRMHPKAFSVSRVHALTRRVPANVFGLCLSHLQTDAPLRYIQVYYQLDKIGEACDVSSKASCSVCLGWRVASKLDDITASAAIRGLKDELRDTGARH